MAPRGATVWDSLVLFTPRRYDGLPGLAFPGDPDGYPRRDEVIAYLEQYATRFDLPIEFNSAVRSLSRTGETVDILIDVTNPGRWMAHCHIADHHESGMMLSLDVPPASAS